MSLIRRQSTDLAIFPPIPNVIDFIEVAAAITSFCWRKGKTITSTTSRWGAADYGVEWLNYLREPVAFQLQVKHHWRRSAKEQDGYNEIFESRCHQQRIDVVETRNLPVINELLESKYLLECYYSFAGADWDIATVLRVDPWVAMQLLSYAKTLRNEPLALESLKLQGRSDADTRALSGDKGSFVVPKV